jgi:hypothetical protein
MGTLKKKYKPKKENVLKLNEYLKKLNNKTVKKVL